MRGWHCSTRPRGATGFPLNALSEECHEIVLTAAVVGREFGAALLTALANASLVPLAL